MTTFLDLPEEIYQLIAELLGPKTIYSCIRVCRSFYSSFIPSLWKNLDVEPFNRPAIDAAHIRANAHHVETISYSSAQTEEYYTIAFPRLHALTLSHYSSNYKGSAELPLQKVQFARLNPSVRKLTCRSNVTLSREFWEAVETEWADLESMDISGFVEPTAADVFWRVCDRVKILHFKGEGLPESLPVLSTLSFLHLRNLTINENPWFYDSYRMWPLELLKQVRTSAGLRRLTWNVEHLGLPMELLVEAMAEGSWPELCELGICAPYGPNDELDENLTKILRALTSGRLTYFALSDGILGPLTLGCLRELYFGHVQELDFGRSAGVPSEMVQEILAGCVHLIKMSAPHIFVRDIATASKSWTCLGLRQLVVFIAKQPDDEDGWDSRVFEQISRLRQLEILNLQRDPYLSVFIGEPRPDEILRLGTLDLRLPARSASEELSNNNGDIICWSSLVRLRQFSFDRDRQTLGMEEVRWMLEHWRHLHSIEGNFKGVDGDGRGGPDDLFRQKDIHFIN